MQRGKYIVLEGGEHVGKSSQTQILAENIGATLVYEPGLTALGIQVRKLVHSTEIEKSPKAQLALHAAARAQLAHEIIRPNLEQGRHVVSDRSWISSWAYQGAMGVSDEDVIGVNQIMLGELMTPDLCIVLDAAPIDVASRVDTNESPDYYESLDYSFHNRVRENFLNISFKIGAVIIDALQPQDVVAEQVLAATTSIFEQ